jgi:hypothetical protein
MFPDRPWRTPAGREARNEQRKLRAAIANGVGIALIVGALIAPLINPATSSQLSPVLRAIMLLGGWLAHLLACRFVRDIEDRS